MNSGALSHNVEFSSLSSSSSSTQPAFTSASVSALPDEGRKMKTDVPFSPADEWEENGLPTVGVGLALMVGGINSKRTIPVDGVGTNMDAKRAEGSRGPKTQTSGSDQMLSHLLVRVKVREYLRVLHDQYVKQEQEQF
jgi:hypothetical protein